MGGVDKRAEVGRLTVGGYITNDDEFKHGSLASGPAVSDCTSVNSGVCAGDASSSIKVTGLGTTIMVTKGESTE